MRITRPLITVHPPHAQNAHDGPRIEPARLAAWLAFLVSVALLIVAGLASAPGCTSTTHAAGVVETAEIRLTDLRAREQAAADAGKTTAADQLRRERERLEAQVAAVKTAAADNAPSPTEAAAGTAAALIPGGIGVGITAAIGIIGHLVRSRTLAQRVGELQATLEHADDTTDNIVESIEQAKQANPAFAAEFARSAGLIRARQTSAARKKVNTVQHRRRALVAEAIKDGTITDRPGPSIDSTPAASPLAQAASA